MGYAGNVDTAASPVRYRPSRCNREYVPITCLQLITPLMRQIYQVIDAIAIFIPLLFLNNTGDISSSYEHSGGCEILSKGWHSLLRGVALTDQHRLFNVYVKIWGEVHGRFCEYENETKSRIYPV